MTQQAAAGATTTKHGLVAVVNETRRAEVFVEYDRTMGRLRIAEDDDRTIAVYSQGGLYRLLPDAPEGHVVVSNTHRIDDVVDWLVRRGVAEVVDKRRDFDGTTAAIMRVLI